ISPLSAVKVFTFELTHTTSARNSVAAPISIRSDERNRGDSMSRTRSRSIRSKMATRPKLPRVCFRCRRFPGCGEREGNDEARMTNDEGSPNDELQKDA